MICTKDHLPIDVVISPELKVAKPLNDYLFLTHLNQKVLNNHAQLLGLNMKKIVLLLTLP